MKQITEKDCLIVTDSCCEVPSNYRSFAPIVKVPFFVSCNGRQFIDNEKLNREELLDAMHYSKEAPKSACPSPEAFLKAYKEYEDVKYIFVVTVSGKLSGSYGSASLALQMLDDESEDKFVHVFDSKGASATEVNVALMINDYLEEHKDNFDEYDLISSINKKIDECNTYFVLQNYENFIKNGRISKSKVVLANALRIYPVMKGEDGVIELADKVRGLNKALTSIVDAMKGQCDDLSERRLVITHCKGEKSLNVILHLIEEKNYNFKEIVVNETDGLSTMYAMDGGIILSY